MKKAILLLFVLLLSPAMIFAQSNDEQLAEIGNQLREELSSKELLERLQPSLDDLQKIFLSTEDVNAAWLHLQYYYVDIEGIEIKPKADQTDIQVHQLTGAELKSNVESGLPKAYYDLGKHLKDNVHIFAIEYTKPGEESGYLLGAFFHVREHWIFIPDVQDIFE